MSVYDVIKLAVTRLLAFAGNKTGMPRRILAVALALAACLAMLPAPVMAAGMTASDEDLVVDEASSEVQSVVVNGGAKFRTAVRSQSNVTGKLNVSLLYGDKENYPEGVGGYTHDDMSGFIKLEPTGSMQGLKDIEVRLMIPKEYVEKDSVKLPPFSTDSGTTYTIIPVSEDEENYYIGIQFGMYNQTQTWELPFSMSFKDDITPENYELRVMAAVMYPDGTVDTSNSLIYKPLYKPWGIDKYVNTHEIVAFKQDGVEAVVAVRDDSGNPYLDDRTYVKFCFVINNVKQDHAQENWRDVTEVTLTDTLPHYEKQEESGDIVDAIAVFDPEANPGWSLSADGKTVSKTYTGEKTGKLLLAVCDDTLRLRFPGIVLRPDPMDETNLIARLTNKVHLEAVPSNAADGEASPVADDTLDFVISTDPSTQGHVFKVAMKGNIYDSDEYKTNPYPWRIRLLNAGARPLEHIVISDKRIEEDGKVVLEGLDPALKFVKLESDMGDSKFVDRGDDWSFAGVVHHVTAWYTDGSSEDISIKTDGAGNFVVEFDKNKICDGYEIVFKDEHQEDFQLRMAEAVSFKAYTVYRDPEGTKVPEGAEKATYKNSVRAVNWYEKGDSTKWGFSTAWHDYDMFPVREELQIGKWVATIGDGSGKIFSPGDELRYWISIAGFLEDGKDYGDVQVVDLLPDGIDFGIVCSGPELFKDGVTTPKIEENYHNSGRTALIWTLSQTGLKGHLNSGNNRLSYAAIIVSMKVREDAHSGTIRNDVYILGDNLADYSGNTGGTMDIYDLDNDGKTDDRIAYASCDAVIQAAKSVYAEKSIAPAGGNNWNKQGLSLDAGSEFDYQLKVVNELDADSGLVVYDVFPSIGDRHVIGTSGRGSEFQVSLRKAIEPPEGYKVWYTTSADVYEKTMAEMVPNGDVWFEADANTDWPFVTAFKLEADAGTILSDAAAFELRVPVRVSSLSGSSEILAAKAFQDGGSGTTGYLEAINTFGFWTEHGREPKESNPVWARLRFAGFKVLKADSTDGHGLEGARFLLTRDGDGSFRMEAVSDENGLLEFRGLQAGEYALTETEAPVGYMGSNEPLRVLIIQDPLTMDYSVEIDGVDGSGTGSDPFVVKNGPSGMELPVTGGNGAAAWVISGSMLVLCAAFAVLCRKKCMR